MFNFLKPQTKVRQKQASTSVQSVNDVIEEIHETFFTEVDRLLAEAKVSNSLDTDKQALIEKNGRLLKLGFANTKECIEAQAEIGRLDKLRTENQKKQNLIDAINYFSMKYPHYKFITEESVKKICLKYGFIYGSVSNFIGTVPDENLKHMEDFHIAETDECYQYERYSVYVSSKERYGYMKTIYSSAQAKAWLLSNNVERISRNLRYDITETMELLPLEIVAPPKDFNLDGMEVKNFKLSKKPIEIPDPVVLKPVYYCGRKYYLIVTAWGKEASDPLVLNERHN